LLIAAEQFLDPLFGLTQLAVTLLEQCHPLFVSCQRILQADLAVLQLMDDALQIGERLFERRPWLGVIHWS